MSQNCVHRYCDMSLGSDKGFGGAGGSGAKSTLVRGVTKKVFRTRELVLQNLGKVDKTQDELFDEFLSNFARQQLTAAKLQKYLNGYVQVGRMGGKCKTELESAFIVYV